MHPIPRKRHPNLLYRNSKDEENLLLSKDMFDYENTPVGKSRPIFPYSNPNPMPVVSIITTYYDSGDIIRETAQSIFQQTYKNFEWIVVNDGSKSDQVLLNLAKQYKFVYINQKDNVGLPAARNLGVDEARGKYFVFLDADDLIEPTFLEKCIWFMETNPAATYVNTFSVAFGTKKYLHVLTHQDHSQMLLEKNVFPVTSMIRAYNLKRIGLFDASLKYGMEDWDLLLKMQAKGHCGMTIEEFHFWYRTHSEVRWRQDDGVKGEQEKAKFLEMLKTRYPSLFQQGITKCFEESEVDTVEIENPLQVSSGKTSILFILESFADTEENIYYTDLIQQFSHLGYHVSVASTTENPADSATIEPILNRHTVDVFNLHKFVPERNHGIFIEYLVSSRSFSTLFISHSELGYKTLPMLPRSLRIIEICHEPHPYRNPVAHLINQTIITSQDVVSKFLRPPLHLTTIYYGADPIYWNPKDFPKSDQAKTPILLNILRVGDDIDQSFLDVLDNVKIKVVILIDILMQDINKFKTLPIVAKLGNLQSKYGADRFQVIRLMESLDQNFKMRKILDFMAKSDFFWISNRLDLTPWIFRALAMENVILGNRAPGRDEIITLDVGFLRGDDADPKAYFEQIQTVINDRGQLERMKKQCRDMIKHMNIRDMMESYLEVLLG